MNKILSPDLPSIEEVIADIQRVSETKKIKVSDMTIEKYSKNGGKFDGRKLRRLGGFSTIAKSMGGEDALPEIVNNKYLNNRAKYVKKLENMVGEGAYVKQAMYDGFKEALDAHGSFTVSKDPSKPKPATKIKKRRANVVLISDTHMGLNIKPDEVMTNGYNWEIAARRLGKLTEQVALYKMDHRDECEELHVCLGGDLGQGQIHLDEGGTEEITYQVIGIVSYLTQMIDYWRNYYTKIYVHCTPDNHMRLVHKGNKGSAMSQKFDSFATMVHVALQAAFRTTKDVEFNMPKTVITTFHVLGMKYALTHGDTAIRSGNVGSSINVKNISNQILRLNAAQPDNKPYDAVLMGHVHTPCYIHLSETKTYLVVNGTASSTDGFAESIGYFRNIPAQVMWEVVDKYPVGDFRIVDLGDADKDDSYLQFIKPYNYELSVL